MSLIETNASTGSIQIGPQDLERAFAQLDENLKLDVGERARAVLQHNAMTAFLIGTGLVRGAFLQGSFARKTMRKPLRDIDKVVLLADSLAYLREHPNGANLAMDLIEEQLRKRYPNATVSRSRHAVKVTISPEQFSFDLVPAFDTEGGDTDVFIANADSGGWDRSNTRQLIRVIADRNSACEGQFIHQVRMAKEFTARVADDKGGLDFPGLHVESICFQALSKTLAHPVAISAILSAGAAILRGPYTDPTGVDELSRRLKPGVAAIMAAHFGQAAAVAESALAAAAGGDTGTALRLWHDLLGDAFPAPPSPTERDILATAFGGGSVVEGLVTPTRAGRQLSIPTRSWCA